MANQQLGITRLADRVRAEEDGQAMVEYALILTFVALAVVGTLSQIGPLVSSVFASIVSGF